MIKNYKVKQNKIYHKSKNIPQKQKPNKIEKEIQKNELKNKNQPITKGKNFNKNKRKRLKKWQKKNLENENSNTKFTINLTVIPSKGT